MCLLCWDDLQVLGGRMSEGGLSGLEGRCPCTHSLPCYCDSSGHWWRLGPLQWELMADIVGHLFYLSWARTRLVTCSLLSFGSLWANLLLLQWLLHPLAWTVHLPLQTLSAVGHSFFHVSSPPGLWRTRFQLRCLLSPTLWNCRDCQASSLTT